VLLCSPNYLNEASLPLCVSGEPESQPLAFSKPCTLWASPANPGSLELANDLAAAFPGLTVSTVADVGSSASARPSTALRGLARRSRRAADVTHMLLYLNQNTWLEEDGERLAEQVKQAREDKLKIVMAHENDPALGGCQFSRFFEVTPQERMSHSDARPEPPLPPQPSPPNAAGAHRRRTLQGPGKIVLPGAPPQGARPLSHSSTLPFVTSRAVPARRFRSCFWQRA
jgi:hypothetical protein